MSSVKSPATPESKFKSSKTARVAEAAVVVLDDSETIDTSETSSVALVVTRLVGRPVVVASDGLLLVLLPVPSGGFIGLGGLSVL